MEEEPDKEWLWQVYQHSRGSSRDTLFAYFRGQSKKNDLTPEIINLVNTSVKTCFPEQVAPSSNSSSISNNSSLQEWVVDKPACATYLYYIVAQHILQKLFPPQSPDAAANPASQQQQQQQPGPAGRRFKGLLRQATPSPACSELVSSEEFHLPLVECAVQLVAFIAGEEHQQQYHWATQQLQQQGFAASLWQAARNFLECFSASGSFPLPPILQQYLQRLQELLLDAPVLATGSQLYSIIGRGGGCHFQEGDSSLVDNVLVAYAAQAVQRAQLVGWRILQQQRQLTALQQQQQQVLLPESFPEQCAWLMDKVLMEHVGICFGQAMSVVVACVVYVTAKLLQASVTFKMVTEVIGACVENTPAGIFQRTELQPPQAGAAAEYGDVRMFYNARFLPAIEGSVRQYLQDYQQHASSITINPADTAADASAAAGAAAGAHDMDTTEEAPQAAAVQATPAAAVAGVTPGRRPFGALQANTQAAGASTVYAAKLVAKPAQGFGKGTMLEGLPSCLGGSSTFSNYENEVGITGAAGAAAPIDDRLLASTQPEQPGSLAARTNRRSTRSKAVAGVGVAGAAAAVPGHVGHLGLFGSAGAMGSAAHALVGRTPTRLMR